MHFSKNILFIFLIIIPVIFCTEEFTIFSENQTRFIGEEATFHCEFKVTEDDGSDSIFGAQAWEYKLPKSGEFILLDHQADNFTLIDINGVIGHSTIILNEVTRNDHGLAIRCSLASLSRTVFLFVYSPPGLFLSDNSFQVREGQEDPLVIAFLTEGYPDPIYSDRFDWFYNSELLEESFYIELTSISLTLTNPFRIHTGTYSLTTHTPAGNATADFYVDVVYQPEVGIGILSLTVEYAVEGDRITLSCGDDLQGNPTPTVMWYKNNSFTSLSNTETLTFESVSLSDSGLYICNISNNQGYITTEIQLYVYGSASPPIWDRDGISVGATNVLFVWSIPLVTYRLQVDSFELIVQHTSNSSLFFQVTIPGQNLSYSISYEDRIFIYPDTLYTAYIRAYTYNNTIQGNTSIPLTIRTLPSSPILTSIFSRINTTAGLYLNWRLYSSGLANETVDYYQLEFLMRDSIEFTIQIQTNYFLIRDFKPHSTYTASVLGSRDGLNGEPVQTEIYTSGYGTPPIPQSILTSQIVYENHTNILLMFRQVLTPFIDFSVRFSCRDLQKRNASLPIISIMTVSDFLGGNLSVTLTPMKFDSVYNCTADISNIFGNISKFFRHIGPGFGRTTTTITTTTVQPPTPTPSPAFLIVLIVVIILLLIILLSITGVIILIGYLCYKRSHYTDYRLESVEVPTKNIKLSKPGETFDYETMGANEELSVRGSVDIVAKCETTSI